jgi:hypothetical protein
MQNLSGTSSGKNNKSCRILHNESDKIEFTFLCFSTIFYEFYKILQNSNSIWDSLLHRGPWNFPGIHRYAPGSRKTPWKEWEARNWVLGATSPESGEAGGAPGREGGGKGSGAHPSSLLLVGWGVWRPGGGARRRPASAAAAAGKSGEARANSGNTRRGKLPWGPREDQGGWTATEWRGGRSSPCNNHGGRWRSKKQWRAHPARRRAGLGFWRRPVAATWRPRALEADRGSSAVRRRGKRGQRTAGARTGARYAAGTDSRDAPECVPASERCYD